MAHYIMTRYVNPGNDDFMMSLKSRVYVDKTDLIAYTNSLLGTEDRFLCVSRPRRFGKSMAANMLVSYYSKGCDSKGLFSGRKIETHPSYSSHRNVHNVIRIDVQRFLFEREDIYTFIDTVQKKVIKELISAFPSCSGICPEMRLQEALVEIYLQISEKFIFIIDEWDSVFRLAQDEPDVQKRYLNFLRSLFKGAPYVDLAYMTGILPIKKYGEHSAVNMFAEYSMIRSGNLKSYFGFTEEEVKDECLKNNASFDEMKKWYDGYLLDGVHIYNPKSVKDALIQNDFSSHWTGTETYEALKIYIERNYDGLKEAVISMLGGGRCRINPRLFQNDMTTFKSKDDVLTLLVHLGYLTYDKQTSEVFIPNLEVAHEFLDAIEGMGWSKLLQSLDKSSKLLESTWRMDGNAVAAALDEIHSDTTSLLQYNNENSLACALFIAYYSASAYYAKPIREFPSGKGLADVVYLPRKDVNRPALVIELKWDESAWGALAQIKEKRYTSWPEDYTGDILLVGINYDPKSKVHKCVIERYEK